MRAAVHRVFLHETVGHGGLAQVLAAGGRALRNFKHLVEKIRLNQPEVYAAVAQDPAYAHLEGDLVRIGLEIMGRETERRPELLKRPSVFRDMKLLVGHALAQLQIRLGLRPESAADFQKVLENEQMCDNLFELPGTVEDYGGGLSGVVGTDSGGDAAGGRGECQAGRLSYAMGAGGCGWRPQPREVGWRSTAVRWVPRRDRRGRSRGVSGGTPELRDGGWRVRMAALAEGGGLEVNGGAVGAFEIEGGGVVGCQAGRLSYANGGRRVRMAALAE